MLQAFVLQPATVKIKAYGVFRTVVAVMCVAGLVAVICFVTQKGFHYNVVDYYFGNSKYIDYGFAYLVVGDKWDTVTFRLCGLCNEPGELGTMVALLLIADRMRLKKWQNIVMLAAGIFTFSMAFYATLIVYFMLRLMRKPVRMLFVLIVAFTLLPIITQHNFENENIDRLVKRFEYSDGEFAGDNRLSYESQLIYKDFLHSKYVFFGHGTGFNTGGGSLSVKEYFMQYGFIGSALIFGILFYAGWMCARGNRMAIILLICFFINIYQRPGIYTMYHFLILFGGIEMLVNQQRQEIDKMPKRIRNQVANIQNGNEKV